MKKLIPVSSLVILTCLLAAQPQEQPQEQTAAEAQIEAQVEPQAKPPEQAKSREMNLKNIRFPQPFIHTGKEYPAGNYWLVLTTRDGQPLFTVQNAQKETLFEELAVVKERGSGRSGSWFRVNKKTTKDQEYFRVKVTTPDQWLMGYFLVKK